MLSAVHEQASTISKEWSAANRDPEKFSSIARDFSDVSSLNIGPDFLIKSLNPDYFKYQTQSVFSNFNCRPYSDQYMYCEVLNWSTMDTDLHNHDFVGILWQIHGIAIDVSYSYLDNTLVSDGVEYGKLEVKKVDLLKGSRKDTQNILTGNSYIHAVGHVENPTTSLLFRSQPLHGLEQSIFIPPGVKLAFELDARDRKAIRLFNFLFSSKEEEIEGAISSYLNQKPASLANILSVIIRLQPIYDKLNLYKLCSMLNIPSDFQEIVLETSQAFSFYRKHRDLSWNFDSLKDRIEYMQMALSYGVGENLDKIKSMTEII